MPDEKDDNSPSEESASNAADFDNTPIGLCFRTGADPNPYPATKAQCILDGGQWTPGVIDEP